MATKDKLINLEDLKAVRDHDMAIVDNKVDQIGSYPDLIAGTADNLLSSSYQTDKTPYIIRRTPYGAREKGSIVGGSIVWNQLADNSRPPTSRNGLTFTAGDGFFTISGTATSETTATGWFKLAPTFHTFAGHVTIESTKLVSGTVEGSISFRAVGSTTFAPLGTERLIKPSTNSMSTIYVSNGAVCADAKIRIQVFDLTLMFGSTIADYIYTQEQATAGAGVALAKAWAGIVNDYYPYDAGSIKSVTGLTSHKMTDGNGDIIGEYPLDSSLTLRGILKLDGDSIYYDGDIYRPSGEVERRYVVRAYQSGDESDANVLTDGTNTVYKLATPTTEQAEPYTALQICDPNGTEEWVGASMPVGHDTKYYADLKGKIEDIPDAPSADGTYTLRVTVSGGVATYSWE